MNRICLLLALILLAGCRQEPVFDNPDISIEQLEEHIAVLSSDEFEGRGPSSVGEEKTVAYLEKQFGKYGLEPANGTSFTQKIPLVEITATNSPALNISFNGVATEYSYKDSFMGWTKRVTDMVEVQNSELVFVGYGIVAPEYGWDDYDGVDVTGKTVVMLVNDPGYASGDPAFFKGKTMTYYGRWTYKYEEAARQGAAAAIIVHETGPAGYPWGVVSSSWSGGQFDLVSEDNNQGRVAVEGWIQYDVAQKLFDDAGFDLRTQIAAAGQPGFSAFSLGGSASVTIENANSKSESVNIAALLQGAERPDEFLIYMAHWDHLGIGDPDDSGDTIYNGAMDNASGTAGLIEMAEFFAAGTRPARSVLFLAVGVEEQGLLGSKYYAENPLFPLEKTVATINMDGMNIWGPMRDITVIGIGNSYLDNYVEDAALARDRVVRPDPNPEKGYFFRSDHFSFAKKGVPSLYTDNGIDHLEHGEEWTRTRMAEWTETKYHAPGDEMEDWWDLAGAVDDLELLTEIGLKISNEDAWVDWKEGSAFKAVRDESAAARSR